MPHPYSIKLYHLPIPSVVLKEPLTRAQPTANFFNFFPNLLPTGYIYVFATP